MCCSLEMLLTWYIGFKIFLEKHNLLNKAPQIWNAEESGFSLCAMSGKVLSIRGCKNVYSITADMKEQIIVLSALSASGETIPLLQIFSGRRFKYNPVLNCACQWGKFLVVLHLAGGRRSCFMPGPQIILPKKL